MDSKPEALAPELSNSARRIDTRKLNSVPWDHSGKHPGSIIVWWLFRAMISIGHRIIFRNSKADEVPDIGGGRISVSTHINGLVDPLVIVHSQHRRFTALGRHDLVTRPILGWWTRGLGIQPILRKAETDEGITNSDFAGEINRRSMLTVSNCISNGYSAVVFPEGTSHQDSVLHGFKTGPFRTVFAAAALAELRNLPQPHLQPAGLHWRNHTKFRTDHHVEYLDPIPIPNPYSQEQAQILLNGEWVEPPKSQVIAMRDSVYSILKDATPDSPDWETYRAWVFMAHRKSKTPIVDLHQEVLETREMRQQWREGNIPQELFENASNAAKILHDHDLDARDLTVEGQLIRKRKSIFSLILGASVMLIAMPVFALSTFPQAILAWWLGDRTDEGIDARTTYHLMAAMFSLPLFWPIIGIIWTLSAVLFYDLPPLFTPLFFVALFPIFYLAAILTALGYDLVTDFRRDRRRAALIHSKSSRTLYDSTNSVDEYLVALK